MEVQASNIVFLLRCTETSMIKSETHKVLFKSDLWELALKRPYEILVCSNPHNDCKNDIGSNNMEKIEKDCLAGKKDSSGNECCLSKIAKLAALANIALLQSTYIWIGNSGATVHYTNDRTVGINIHDGADIGTVGIHGAMNASSIVDITRAWCNQFGEEQLKAILKNAQYNPRLNFNLFSIGEAIKEGWSLSADQGDLVLINDSAKLVLDIMITTKNGVIFCA